MRKIFCKAKILPSEFKVTTPKNLLINNQVVISMNLTTILAYPKILTYSWTFTPILNWTWSCSSIFSFEAQTSNMWLTFCTNPSTWLILVTWIIFVGCKVIHFINDKDTACVSVKTFFFFFSLCVCFYSLIKHWEH